MDTVIACLTPPGKAAIATLGVRGPRALDITRELFRPARGPAQFQPSPGRFWYGKLGKDESDEIILAVKQIEPEPILELHCHGGIEVVRMIEELYQERGAKILSWMQFPDQTNPLLEMLVHAPTVRTAAILLDQIQRAWERFLPSPLRRRGVGGEGEGASLERLRELIPLGRHLVTPWKVVIGGAPNVGKSSLVNALAGYTRSVVAPIPGTTRDTVSVQIAIDGWPIELTDTAGIRAATGDLELQGIERARAALRDADLWLWVVDGASDPVWPDHGGERVILINKIDLPAAWDWDSAKEAMRISALSREGLPELCEVISGRLVPAPPAPGEAVPCLAEQVEWLRAASE